MSMTFLATQIDDCQNIFHWERCRAYGLSTKVISSKCQFFLMRKQCLMACRSPFAQTFNALALSLVQAYVLTHRFNSSFGYKKTSQEASEKSSKLLAGKEGPLITTLLPLHAHFSNLPTCQSPNHPAPSSFFDQHPASGFWPESQSSSASKLPEIVSPKQPYEVWLTFVQIDYYELRSLRTTIMPLNSDQTNRLTRLELFFLALLQRKCGRNFLIQIRQRGPHPPDCQ